MNLNVEVWQRKPFYVEAVQVTEENMETVAEWCGGRLIPINKDESKHFIKVFVKNPMSARQTKAFVDDWILKSRNSFKVYKHESFLKVFDKTDFTEVPQEDVSVFTAIDPTHPESPVDEQ